MTVEMFEYHSFQWLVSVYGPTQAPDSGYRPVLGRLLICYRDEVASDDLAKLYALCKCEIELLKWKRINCGTSDRRNTTLRAFLLNI